MPSCHGNKKGWAPYLHHGNQTLVDKDAIHWKIKQKHNIIIIGRGNGNPISTCAY